MSAYIVGWNMPGYMPESDPWAFDTIEEARDYLVEEMERHADNEESWPDDHVCDDIPCPVYGDNCGWDKANDIRANAEEVKTWVNGDLTYAGDLAYWISYDPDVDAEAYNNEQCV